MGSARPFAAILEEIGGLCRQLADAHEREVAALELRLAAPPAPTGGRELFTFPGVMDELSPDVVNLDIAAVTTKASSHRGPGLGGWDSQEPVVSSLITGSSITWLGDAGGAKDQHWQQLSISLKKEKMSEDLDAQKGMVQPSVMQVFKLREVWNLNDNELLRIKCKAWIEPGVNSAEYSKKALGKLRSAATRIDQRWDWFMVHPQSNARRTWDLTGILWLAFDIVALPLQVFPLPRILFLDVANILGNIYWTADIGASLITGTYSKSIPVMRFKDVSRRYLRSWFFFDIFLVLTGWCVMVLQSMSNIGTLEMTRAFRTARFLRILRYLRFARLFRLVKAIEIFRNLQERANSEKSLFALSVLKLVGAVVFMSHLLACCWYGVGNVPNGWVRIESRGGILDWDVGDQYLYTYQWSLSRLHPSTIEKNLLLRTTNERVFAVFGGVFAMVVGAGIISTITNLMREFQEKHKRRKHNLSLVQTFVLKYAISPQLAVRAKRYIDFEHEAKLRSQREAELLTILPHDLVLDFQYEAFSPTLTRHNFFTELHCTHLRTHYDICHRALSSAAVLSGEVVFTAGDACSSMRFITAGKFRYALGHPQHRQATGSDLAEDIAVGVELSEAVLWTPWEHRGELFAEHGGTVVVVCAEEFADVLRGHEQALVASSIHARCFVEELNAIGSHDLSDLRARDADHVVSCEEESTSIGFLARGRHMLRSTLAPCNSESLGVGRSSAAAIADGPRGTLQTQEDRVQQLGALRRSYPDGFECEPEDD